MIVAVLLAIGVTYAVLLWLCTRILAHFPWLYPIVLPASIVAGLYCDQKHPAWRYVLGGGVAFFLGLTIWLFGTDKEKESAGPQDAKSEVRETKRRPGFGLVLVGMWFVGAGVLEWVVDVGLRGVVWLYLVPRQRISCSSPSGAALGSQGC
jgi:hypothetical protein